MIGSSVFSKLQSLNISALENSAGTTRIYPNYVNESLKNYPQIVYDCTDYTPDYGMDGTDGVPTIDVKITCVGLDYDDADALAKTISTSLDGTLGTWGATVVLGCFATDVSEDHFVDTDLETVLVYTKEITFKVIYRE